MMISRKFWGLSLVAACLAALAAAPAAEAVTLHSGPGATRTTAPCAANDPCRLDSAVDLAASGDDTGLAWVAQTATNTVVGYDLATGIPVEKVRYRTVRQPNSLAFDDASGTLYVVSGAGAGVQVIASAGAGR